MKILDLFGGGNKQEDRPKWGKDKYTIANNTEGDRASTAFINFGETWDELVLLPTRDREFSIELEGAPFANFAKLRKLLFHYLPPKGTGYYAVKAAGGAEEQLVVFPGQITLTPEDEQNAEALLKEAFERLSNRDIAQDEGPKVIQSAEEINKTSVDLALNIAASAYVGTLMGIKIERIDLNPSLDFNVKVKESSSKALGLGGVMNAMIFALAPYAATVVNTQGANRVRHRQSVLQATRELYKDTFDLLEQIEAQIGTGGDLMYNKAEPDAFDVVAQHWDEIQKLKQQLQDTGKVEGLRKTMFKKVTWR